MGSWSGGVLGLMLLESHISLIHPVFCPTRLVANVPHGLLLVFQPLMTMALHTLLD